jgi:eukaryotic-like serine/threonine-protein kinase
VEVILGGRYRLIAPLGEGGMGQVWRGVDTALDRPVAVKTIRLAGMAGADYDEVVKRFRREAKAVAALNHPNIVTAHDFGVDGDGDARMPYLVMEFIDGRSLATEIADRGRADRGGLAVDRVVAIGLDVCAGLGAAHRAGVVHRDLKLANLMTVAGTDRIKIVDFGIARSAQLSRLTRTGGLLGTLAYMAPEQVTGGEIDGRTDLYALGCVLYELLTGGSAFTATEPAQFLHAHLNVAPRPLRQLRPDAPAALETLLLDLLAKAPHQRPPDADTVAARLKPFGSPVVAAPTIARAAAPPPVGVNIADIASRVVPDHGIARTATTVHPLPVRHNPPDAKPRPTDPTAHRSRRTVWLLILIVVVVGMLVALLTLMPSGGLPTDHQPSKTPTAPASKVSRSTVVSSPSGGRGSSGGLGGVGNGSSTPPSTHN